MIKVKKLTPVYNDSSIVLNNISFTVEKGQCMLLVGPNGAGKSTILRILAGKFLTKNKYLGGPNHPRTGMVSSQCCDELGQIIASSEPPDKPVITPCGSLA